MSLWQDYLRTQFDVAHILSELGFAFAEFVVLAILWGKIGKPLFVRYVRKAAHAEHLEHDEVDSYGCHAYRNCAAVSASKPPSVDGPKEHVAWRGRNFPAYHSEYYKRGYR